MILAFYDAIRKARKMFAKDKPEEKRIVFYKYISSENISNLLDSIHHHNVEIFTSFIMHNELCIDCNNVGYKVFAMTNDKLCCILEKVIQSQDITLLNIILDNDSMCVMCGRSKYASNIEKYIDKMIEDNNHRMLLPVIKYMLYHDSYLSIGCNDDNKDRDRIWNDRLYLAISKNYHEIVDILANKSTMYCSSSNIQYAINECLDGKISVDLCKSLLSRQFIGSHVIKSINIPENHELHKMVYRNQLCRL